MINMRARLRGHSQTLSAALAIALLAGCAVGPDYTPPKVDAPDRFAASIPEPGPARDAEVTKWWTRFNDPVLDSLVSRAVEGNKSLLAATQRVLEARALRGIADSSLYPTVDATGGLSRSKQSETLGGPFADDKARTRLSAGLDAGWEIDFWGRVRRGVEAADADLAATEWSRRDVLVTLVAEVARNYAEARAFQSRLEVARRAVRVQEDTLAVAEARLKAGVSSELEVAQARALLETRRATVPLFETGFRQASHRLAVLLGKYPSALSGELAEPRPIPALAPAPIEVGVPSELLKRRPDVVAAERRLAAATARIGVATGDLYPRVNLGGSLGLESRQIGSLFDSDSAAWSFGPSIRWNIFDARRIRNNIKAADARSQEALANFEGTVLESFLEVEDRIVALRGERERRAALGRSVEANTRAVDLSSDLFRSGLRDFLNVLDSQRALYDAQDQLVQSELAVATNAIALYKSLGGGWDAEQPPEPKPAQ